MKIVLLGSIPKGDNVRKDWVGWKLPYKWIHPFLQLSSDFVAESIDEAAQWVKKYLKSPEKHQLKSLSVFDDAIDQFEAVSHK